MGKNSNYVVPSVDWRLKDFYREQLFRELSNLFKWENLPTSIPVDYLERTLIRYGMVMFYKDRNIGHDVLQCTIRGYNRHNMPIEARAFTPSQLPKEKIQVDRRVKRLADSENAVEDFDEYRDCVLLQNMEYGQSCSQIVDFYAERLARAQQAFDTNLLWANLPYYFQVNSDDMKKSIEKMFTDVFEGKPFVIVDKRLLSENKDRSGIPTQINFIGKDLLDIINEIKMKFKEAVGFETAGVDKAERVNTLEVKSNEQHNNTVLDIMLSQRKIFCEAVNAFYNLNISVDIIRPEYEEYEEEEEDGSNFGGVEEPFKAE